MYADTTNKLPVIFGDDDDEFSGRLVKGTRLKFDNKVWTATDGTPLHESDQFLVMGTDHDLQRWVDGLPEVYTKRPLPDLKELNESVPKDEWPTGRFSNQPEEPWKHVFCVYLVRTDPVDGALFTSINSTSGQKVAYTRLKERIKTMSLLRGRSVLPIVKLSWAMMPSAYGPRPRPDFTIVEWRDLGDNQPAQIEPPKGAPPAAGDQIGKPVEPVTLKEELNDEIGF
jgi:hypothetical protein